MSLVKNDLIKLAKTVANASPASKVAYSFGEEKFSYSDLNDTLRKELNEIAGTFQLYRENKNVILFDDIITTGLTVNELSKILKKAGAKKVLVLIIAKD